MDRETFNLIAALASGLLAVASLVLAAGHWRKLEGWYFQRPVGMLVAAFWEIAPPVFLGADWVFYWPSMDIDTRAAAVHTHDLARNIWLGMLAVISVAYGIGIKSE